VATPDAADTAKLKLANCPSYRLRLSAGDTVRFYDADYDNLNSSAAPVTRTVDRVSSDNSVPETTIVFTTALPAALSPQAILRNARFNTANVRIAGCQFLYTNGHGILLSTEATTVENCYFRNIYSTPIQFEANIVQPLWSEGKGAANVVVRNNTFENNNQDGDSGAASIWAGTSLPWGPTDIPLFKSLLFEGNRFLNSPGPVLSLNNCANVIVRDNRVDTTSLVANATATSAAIVTTRSAGLALGGNTWYDYIPTAYDYGVVYDPGTTSNLDAGTNVRIDMTTAASEKFETYSAGSGFTTAQALGAAGSNWAYAWRTANSLSTGTGTVAATSPLVSGQRLGVTLVTQSGKSASYGAVGRPYTLTSTTSGFYGYAFTFRPDTAPSNLRYQIYETRTRSAGPVSTTTWQIASVNGTWQVFNGAVNGGPNAYVDTGMAVTAGTAYDFTISLDPAARTWAVAIADGAAEVIKTGLNWRYADFTADTSEGVGGRWIHFGGQELLSGSATVGVTGTYSLDDILVVMPAP
ncbi:MAG TPA: right-handed parallel beta-helix repeat-containing protein, partial [Rariglobus sp.]